MENTDQNPTAPSPDAFLAEQLAHCHKAIAECFVCGSDANLSVPTQLECLSVAERLIRVSVALAAALDKSPREFTHRIIVERPNVTPEPDWPTPPPASKSKTIHGGGAPRVRNG